MPPEVQREGFIRKAIRLLLRRRFRCGVVIALALNAATILAGDAPSSGESRCRSTAVVSVPSRPTVSNGTDTTQCGVVEIEYGLERQWPGGGALQDDLAGGFRLGLLPNLDLHWASAAFLHVKDDASDRTGFGDSQLAVKYRLLAQRKLWPSVGTYYQAKAPTANRGLGVGSGKWDYALSLLLSKDVRFVHLDFNVSPAWVGREGDRGFDRNFAFALSGSAPIGHGFGIVAEGYGASSLNAATPAFSSTMLGLTYQASPRCVLDAGLDVGVTAGAPRKRAYVGATYAIGNAYRWWRSQRD